MEWLQYWHWFALSLLLMIAESLGAAGFLVALGMAAAFNGVITLLLDNGWQWQLVNFSLLSILFAVIWWYFLQKKTSFAGQSTLNRPFEAMLGRTTVLTEGIENGRGKIYINDAYWFVTGPELPAGSKVKIVAVEEGSLLLVEPVSGSGTSSAK